MWRGPFRGHRAKCMEMLGGAETVLEMTVEYAKQRVQFGRPVGSFQAVQHHCANMATEVECSRFVAYQAAWRVAEGLPCAREVSMAKAWVSDAYRRVCTLAHQSHAAIGFTKEHNLQLYTRRAGPKRQPSAMPASTGSWWPRPWSYKDMKVNVYVFCYPKEVPSS